MDKTMVLGKYTFESTHGRRDGFCPEKLISLAKLDKRGGLWIRKM